MQFMILALAACDNIGDPLEDYYSGKGPKISELSRTSQSGNVTNDGEQLTISGTRFGSDADAVTVQFGSLNATVVSATDGELVVEVPSGPIEGGPVDVVVGTTNGFGVLEDGYTYQVSDLTENQGSYISVMNHWTSCFGGSRPNTYLNTVGLDCSTDAYTGYTGMSARAEFLDTVFPRFHVGNLAFYGGTDTSPGEWRVEIPGNTFYPDEIRDLRQDVGQVTLRNPLREGQSFCLDEANLATYSYAPGSTNDEGGYWAGGSYRADNSALAEPGTCKEPDSTVLDLGTLDLCPAPFLETFETQWREYGADWPVAQNFFVGPGESNAYDDFAPPTIEVDVPEMGLSGVSLTLPEPVVPKAIRGFNDEFGLNGGETDYWWLVEIESCLDADGDGSATLDEGGMAFEWEPSSVNMANNIGGDVLDAESYIVLTLTQFRLGWLSGEGFPVRATIRVPDTNNYDPTTGLSSVQVPNWVLYQFPSMAGSWGTTTRPGGRPFVDWAESGGDYGYFQVEMTRVAEYALDTKGRKNGDLVFAYSTGEFGFYIDWTNPLDAGACGDCLDQDEDGWTDGEDPDCDVGDVEDNSTFGKYSCNDGIDNDNDGLIDAEDDSCTTGSDSENNCNDEIDNDGDGYTDNADGECAAGSYEAGNDDPKWECVNGKDDDGDGWIDIEDPICVNGDDPEDDGFNKKYICNDGIDNDGHGDVDIVDPWCYQWGAMEDSEEAPFGGDCEDGKDNDGDGYIDLMDPSCEFTPFSEGGTEDDHPTTKECYDGIDNDKDTFIDADDPGCWNGDSVPDGHLDDEGSDN